MREELKEKLGAKLREDFRREKIWSATIHIRAKSEAEAKELLEENLSGIWFEVDDFEFKEVPR